MRLSRAIDRFLEQKQVERDWTPTSIRSYRRVLLKLIDEHGPEVRLDDFEGRAGTEKLRATIAHRWGRTSASTRANVISVLHTFFGWAEEEGFIEDDPSRRIKRPPRRRADIYRPTSTELDLGYRACLLRERAPWLLMAGIGLRAATVCQTRWQDIDLRRGRIHVKVKGGHRDEIPIAPDVIEELRQVYRELEPDQDDHVFTVERVQFLGNQQTRLVRDTKRPVNTKTLWTTVQRICRRAGIRPVGPHALRHGFATRFLRDSDRDVMSLQRLLGHSRLETTRGYVKDLEIDELEEALERATARRSTSVSGSDNTEGELASLTRKEGDGPGRNRTSERSPSASSAGRDDVDAAPAPPLSDEEGGHK